MRRRTVTSALALAVPALLLGAPALAEPSAAWTPERTRELAGRLPDLRSRRTAAGARMAALVAAEGRVSASGLARAIDGGQYACGPTRMRDYITESTKDWTAEDFDLMDQLGLLDWPTYHALLFAPDGPQTYGIDGEYGKELTKTFRRLQGFWDVDGSDILLAAMHGSIFADTEALVPMVTLVFEISEADAREIIAAVQEYLAQPKFDGGRHPLFTFNAFAYSDRDAGPDEALGVPDKIIMGDGILQCMETLGLGDVAPRGILAHEYGHQVQYRLGLFAEHAGTPEATRETELEADALAGYYLSHPRGERLRAQRVDAFIRTDYEVGDCSFASDGHHGTPNQRAATGTWAEELADAKGAKGHVLTAREVSDAFRAELPEILTPDA